MAQLSKPVLVTAIGSIAVLIWVYTWEEPKAPPARDARRVQAITSARGQKTAQVPSSAPVRFERLQGTPRDVFRPLVLSGRGGTGSVGGVPEALIGGEPGWTYAGMAEVDSVPVALLENSRSGDFVFLRPGERWKGAALASVSPDMLRLRTDDGRVADVPVKQTSASAATTASATRQPRTGAPTTGGLPTLPGIPGLGTTPGMPGMPGFPGMPGMPGMGGGAPMMPGMPMGVPGMTPPALGAPTPAPADRSNRRGGDGPRMRGFGGRDGR